MRVYLPVTLPLLGAAHAAGELRPAEWVKVLSGAAPDGALVAHAVTPAVREWYVEGDLEELEYAALTDAAQAALRLLAADTGATRRRVVLAADVPDGAVRASGGGARSEVLVTAPVALADVASVHVDEEGAEAVVGIAVDALPAADAGDDDARFALDEAEAHELLWYDVTEIPDLV